MTFIQQVALVFGIASLGYLLVAAGYFMQGRPGLMIAFVAYVIANAGFIYDLLTYK